MLKAVRMGHTPGSTKLRHLSLCVFMVSTLAGCTGMAVSTSRPVSLVQGPPITDIYTPFDKALSCLNGQLRPDVTFSVGAILDQTGKDAITNGGSGKYISQGAGDMVQSALFRAGVTLLNRRDPRILETEVKWGLRSPKTIAMSNYFITGSVNSLDFIPGGGFDIQVAGVGPQYSQARIIVGLDLSLTDANTSRVVANVSLQKQIAAQDYGVGAGRFAGLTLLNVQMGAGEREATNFALRQMLNLATFELLNQVMDPSLYVHCRDGIPAEYGTLNATRSAVLLSRYKKKLDATEVAKAKRVAPAAVVAEVEAAPVPAPRPVAVLPAPQPVAPAPAPVVAAVVATAPIKQEPALTVDVPKVAPAPVVMAPKAAPAQVVATPVVPTPIVAAPVIAAPVPVAAAPAPVAVVPAPTAVSKPVSKANEPVLREVDEDESELQSKPVAPVSREKLAVAKPQVAPVVAPLAVAPTIIAPKVVAPKLEPVKAAIPAPIATQPVPKTSEPVLREAAEEKPARKKSPVAADSREKLAQVKSALSPAPDSVAEAAEPVLLKPSVKAKPTPAEPAQRPVVSKPALSPVPEPVAAVAKPVVAPMVVAPVAVKPAAAPIAVKQVVAAVSKPVAQKAVAQQEVAKPADKLKPMSKPSLLDSELSVLSADDAPVAAPASKPVVAPSREKTANAGKPLAPTKPVAKVVKNTKPVVEAKSKPAFVDVTSKSNTVAFVSSDDDGSGKYWSDEADDARINSPLH